jgi:hypothetical protein
LTLRGIVEASGVVWGDTDAEPTAEEMREQEDEAGEADGEADITESDCASIDDVCADQNQ